MHYINTRSPLINLSQLQLVAQYMQHQGIALAEVFDEEQVHLIHASYESSGSVQISSQYLNQMLKQLAQYLADPLVSLKIASMIKTENLGILGYLLHACATLGEALLLLKRYGKLINNEMDSMRIESDGDTMHLTWNSYNSEDNYVAELGIAIMMQFTYQLIMPSEQNQNQLKINQISFYHKNPQDKKPYQNFFGCPVLFEQPYIRFSFPTHNLAVALERPDKILLNILQNQAEQVIQALPNSSEFIQDAQRHLINLCQSGEPKIFHLAERMNLSTRTLQRRFSDYQISFQHLLDEVRKQLCADYLKQHIQLSDIAQLLGYSDQSAFTRAYKRWTGNTPHQQRIASHKNI